MGFLSPNTNDDVPRVQEGPRWARIVVVGPMDTGRPILAHKIFLWVAGGGHEMTPKTTKNDDFEPENGRDCSETAGTSWVVPVGPVLQLLLLWTMVGPILAHKIFFMGLNNPPPKKKRKEKINK